MTVGNQATQTQVNSNLTSYAIQLRNLMRQLANQQEFIVNVGSAGLVAMGFTPNDAQVVLNDCSYMNTIAGVYFGTATQAVAFNFDNQLCPLWGGQ